MTPAEFVEWMKTEDLTQASAARALGLARNTVHAMVWGKTDIGLTVELATEGLSARRRAAQQAGDAA